jgi:outer membrane biosynthesis protein TonB
MQATAALRRLVFHGRRAEYRRGYGQTARNQVVAGAIQMKRFGLTLTAAAIALVLAAPAAAQNGSAGQGTTTTITSSPPPPTDNRPPVTQPTTPPANPAPTPTTTVPVTVEPAQPVVVAPPVQTVPQQPVTIQPDVANPNGLADPNDPFANDTALANRNKQGFPWGLLGLLGLLGLIPLFRGKERVRTVYVERDDTPRRVVRERIDEE